MQVSKQSRGRYWVFSSKTGKDYAEAYNFNIQNAPNGNDNWMLVCFSDGSLHDAEISADRHWYPDNWRDDWDLIEVEVMPIDELRARDERIWNAARLGHVGWTKDAYVDFEEYLKSLEVKNDSNR